jgi:5-(carboxyamino)imidazole ribonucleotide synthase
MGYFTAVLDPDPTSPAGLVSHHHIQTGYEDPQGLAELARLRCRDHRIRERARRRAGRLAAHARVARRRAVAVAQDRAPEKAHFVPAACPARPMP